jgi:hypothetical protein
MKLERMDNILNIMESKINNVITFELNLCWNEMNWEYREIKDWKCHLKFRHMVEERSHKSEHGGRMDTFNNCFYYFWLHPETIIKKKNVHYQSSPSNIFCKHGIGNYWKWHKFTKFKILNENPKISKLCVLLYEFILS